MSSLVQHVRTSIRERKLFRRGERILVAVSGGSDSMGLLHLLHALAAESSWKLVVAHFNHQLRGPASDADERLVRRTVGGLRLPFREGRGDVRRYARQHKLSLEMAARELRHQFLAQTARSAKCRVVALAHHADDQVELLFVRLLRGAGGDGLAGMKWRTDSPMDRRVQLVRPLLDVSKEEVTEFVRANQIAFREDASNARLDHLRNRVRRELLPRLRRDFQPALNRTILRTMEVVSGDAEFTAEVAKTWLRETGKRRRLDELPVGLQRRIIQLQLWKLRVEAAFDLIEALRQSPGTPVTVSPDLRLVCNEAGSIRRETARSDRFRSGQVVMKLIKAAGRIEFGDVQIQWRVSAGRGRPLPPAKGDRECFDADAVGAGVILRHWRPGDRFQPIGMGAAVKLQDWFTNRKVPAARRRSLLVATTARGEIFWVENQRIGERFKLTTSTRRRLVWTWKRAKLPDCGADATMLGWPR